MKNATILQLSTRYQLTQTVVILAATMILPVLVHLLHNINGQISGAVLLPIFFAQMIAAFFYKKNIYELKYKNYAIIFYHLFIVL